MTLGENDFAVVPTAVRDQSGKLVVDRSPLDFTISFPWAQRTADATIRLIDDAVSAAFGRKVSGPPFADNLLLQTVVKIGADGETARDMLLKTLRTMQYPDPARRQFATIPKYSWHLYYDPRGTYGYFLNLSPVYLEDPAPSGVVNRVPVER